MSARISVVLLALALAALATGCDKNGKETENGGGPPGVNQEFTGRSWTTDVDETTGNSKTVHHLTAKGQSGKADIDAQLVFKTHDKEGVTDDRCPKEYPYGTNLVSLTWVQSYNDGSAFTAVAKPRGSAVCTDGRSFYAKMAGVVTGGEGPRFKKVTGGTWQAETTVDDQAEIDKKPTSVNTTGTVNASFTY